MLTIFSGLNFIILSYLENLRGTRAIHKHILYCCNLIFTPFFIFLHFFLDGKFVFHHVSKTHSFKYTFFYLFVYLGVIVSLFTFLYIFYIIVCASEILFMCQIKQILLLLFCAFYLGFCKKKANGAN